MAFTSTFYPSLDGVLLQNIAAGAAWAAIRDGAGTEASTGDSTATFLSLYQDDESNKFRYIHRNAFIFNTSALPNGAIITAATLAIYGTSKATAGSMTPSFGVYGISPASDTALVAGDYATALDTLLSDEITYASWSAAGFNTFNLNAAGLAYISKTGNTRFCIRSDYDADNVAPTWNSLNNFLLNAYFTEGGAAYKPRLVVTYKLPHHNSDGYDELLWLASKRKKELLKSNAH